MSEQDGGTAFPIAGSYNGGMTLRDYFAAQALHGLVCIPRARSDEPKAAAEWAYQFADAMLAARKRA